MDLGAVERNCRRLTDGLAGAAILCAVVKADGYGHGLAWCARAAQAGGASWLAVATAREAEELRSHHPSAQILTMGALTAGELDLALQVGSDIGVWREGFRRAVAERAEHLGTRARVHVKYDTGMGRLGEADPETVAALVRDCAADERLQLAGLWTHLATADETEGEGSRHFSAQLERFSSLATQVKREHSACLLHAANSAATLREPGSHFDMVRCGVATYGLDPFGEDPASQALEPALSLESYVADVKRFPRGTSAGYGRRWQAPADTWVGVLPIGYGDGVRRGLGNNAEVLVEGRRYPLVGTVSMDNVTIDLGPETDVRPGARATLIGAQDGERILAEDLARALGTINYEITCGISSRVPRLYHR